MKTEKENVWKILTYVFTCLTFVGAGYILVCKGEANPGYALIPGLFCFIFSQLCMAERRKRN